ncbi:MAG TPA: SpoIIE family protein phosphatase [Microvirga sp.]|jgi:serine phosphatase RsbU (regulator of sigma subunit)
MPDMKIRHILLALTACLGAALILAVTLQIRTEALDYREAQRLVSSNAVREQLLLAAAAMGQERSGTYLHLAGTRGAGVNLGLAREQVDGAFSAAERVLSNGHSTLGSQDQSLTALSAVRRSVADLRAQADQAGDTGNAIAMRWFRGMSQAIDQVQTLRLTLLQQERPQNPQVRTNGLLRYYSGILSESIARNQALLTRAIGDIQSADPATLEGITRNIGRSDLAWELIHDQSATALPEPVQAALREAREDYETTLAPLGRRAATALAAQTRPFITATEWFEVTERSLTLVGTIQQQLLVSSRTRLARELERTERVLAAYAVLLVGGIVAVLLSILVVRNRIVRPIEVISGTMLQLANGDLAASIPRSGRTDEFGEMSDALRVFKANALRRQRLQQDKDQLHVRLREAYQMLRRDLEAAAAIQKTMLPAPATLGDLRYAGLYRPSSLVAGDTFNVLQRDDGKVSFFQVDVAGHGAPAALVSVASHHILSQALLKRSDNAPLSQIVAEINADWPDDLPYFTMIIGEFDAASGHGRMVQAGHPSPYLIGSNGTVRPLGEGGLPVGMIPNASYDDLEFSFTAGDRLVVYSDGLIEAESSAGEAFSEERLEALLQVNVSAPSADLLDGIDAELRRWRGSESLDDDLSVLILEQWREAGHSSGSHSAPRGDPSRHYIAAASLDASFSEADPTYERKQ